MVERLYGFNGYIAVPKLTWDVAVRYSSGQTEQ